MKLFQKKKNNKGFSLVELIVVVAIMAVLIGVLVPTLIRNVEKSRLSKDKTALDEIKNAIEVVLADEDNLDATCTDLELNKTDPKTVNLSGNVTSASSDFWDDVKANLGNKATVTLSSKLKKDAKVKLTIADGHAKIVVDSSENGDYDFTIGD